MSQMLVPVLAANLVGNQLVGRIGIGDAQQCFSETHEHHAFFARQRIFQHELVDTTLLTPAFPDRFYKSSGQFADAGGLLSR